MPRATALARTVDNAINVSKPIDLNASTTFIQVYAISKDVYLKWATSNTDWVKAETFDEVCIAGQMIQLAVPLKADGSFYSKIQVVGREAGGTVIIIEK